MSRDAAPALACLAVQTNSDHALRLYFECYLVADDDLAFWDREACFPTHSDSRKRKGLNAAYACGTVGRKADGGGSDGEISATKSVRYCDFELRRTDRHVQGLAECRIFEDAA
jgi:hypothetical protein